jgi:hypothetical protein
MSAANAAAKKRRSVIPSSSSIEQSFSLPPPQQPQSNASFTLPQVIAIVDNRLVNLEKGMNEIKQSTTDAIKSLETQMSVIVQNETQRQVEEPVVNESENELFVQVELLKTEFTELKNIVLKLQSYTLNAMLTGPKRLTDDIVKDELELEDETTV